MKLALPTVRPARSRIVVAVEKVQNRIARGPARITRRRINVMRARVAGDFGFLPIHRYGPVRNIACFPQFGWMAGHIHQARGSARAQLDARVDWIGRRHSVHRECIDGQSEFERAEGCAPNASIITRHGLLCIGHHPVAKQADLGRLGRANAEGHPTVRMHLG